jgi:hypothetical protein
MEVRIQGRLLRFARLEADKFHYLEDPQTLVDALKKCPARIDLFTFLQRLPETQPKFPYPMEWDNLAVVPVTTYDHWLKEQIGFKARNKAKQAEKKGVVIREVPFSESLVKGIWEVYNECPVRQGAPFRHYGKDLDTVRREEATFLDTSIFIGAFLEERLIGFLKLVHDPARGQAGTMNVVSMISQRDKAPTNALIAHAIKACAERGIPYLSYANFAYGKKQRSSLSDFKERSGFQKIDLPRYYVPLTRAGALAFQLGLHRRFVDRLPESVAARLRDVRAAWYNRKYQSATESA